MQAGAGGSYTNKYKNATGLSDCSLCISRIHITAGSLDPPNHGPSRYTSLAGQSIADEQWITCLIPPKQFGVELWSQILKSPGIIVIGKTLDERDPRYILGICQSNTELRKLYDLASNVVSPKDAWNAMGISLNWQENAKSKEKGLKVFMDRRALIAWTLAKALLASSSTTLVQYVWELVGDDEHLSVTFSRLALTRDILSSKPAIRIQFLVRYHVYNLLQDDNLKGDALIDLTTRDADTCMERLSAVALAKTGDLNANLETELQETRLMWHFFEASGGCSDLIQQKYNWEYTIGDRLTKRGQLLRVDYEHVERGYKSEAIREMILKSEVGKALNVTQIDGILAEIDPAHD